jgi:hypothetical protein
VTATAQERPSGVRDWWLRLLLVLQRPRPVFVALRDESREALSDRSEQLLLVIWLAGIAYAIASPTASHLMDDSDYDGLLVAVWAFIAGGIVGGFAYFLLGALLQAGVTLLGSQGTYRRSRQVLAFSCVPLVLSLVLVPVRLALYGEDVFRSGGSDAGSGAHVFAAFDYALAAWALGLLVIGVRSVHGWTWRRAGSAVAISLGIALAIGAVVALVYRLGS